MSLDRLELVSTGAVTGSGQTGYFPVPTLTMAHLEVGITAASGTIALSVWLEVSSDKVNWYEMPLDFALKSTGDAAGGSVRAACRNVVDAKTTTTAETFLAVIKHLPAGYVRLRWTLTGTTPSVTFGAVLCGK